MSMYNLMHGENPIAVILLACVHANRETFHRYRDAFLSADGTKVHILTRTGGNNRHTYKFNWDTIRHHPNYISDRDDDFGSTYAWVTFKVEEDFLESTKPLATGMEPPSLREMTDEVMNNPRRVQELLKDPRIQALATQLLRTMQSGKGPIDIIEV